MFSLPTFNLVCGIWHQPNLPPLPPSLTAPCNLAFSRRVQPGSLGSGGSPVGIPVSLLLPAGTDVRAYQCATGQDYVEVPVGSGRIYAVLAVDDAGKGFANEHRVAVIVAVATRGPWPSPIP